MTVLITNFSALIKNSSFSFKADSKPLLNWAAMKGDMSLLQLLLTHKALLPSFPQVYFCLYCRLIHVYIPFTSMQSQANANVVNSETGDSPLCLAVW